MLDWTKMEKLGSNDYGLVKSPFQAAFTSRLGQLSAGYLSKM